MKIAILTNTFSEDLIGGSNVYTAMLARQLARLGNDVVVIATSNSRAPTRVQIGGITVYKFRPLNVSTSSEVGKKSALTQALWTLLDIYSHRSYRQIRKILEAERPDLVHLHTPVGLTLSAFDVVRHLNLPLVFTAHDYLLLCRRVILVHRSGVLCNECNVAHMCKLYRLFVKSIVNKHSGPVLFGSNYTAGVFRDARIFQRASSVVLPPPVSIAGTERENCSDNLARGEMSKEHLNLLFVGSLTRHKGVQVAIEAVRKIRSPAVRLTLIGSGRYESELRQAAGGDARIIFMGKVPNREIAKHYRNADLVIVPSVWYEVFGMVILEAFRAGVPVVASRIGGIVEVVKHGRNGYLFEAGNPQSLVSVLETIMADRSVLEDLGRNAREDVDAYDLPKHIERLLKIYKHTLELGEAHHAV